jgi:peptide/nickel transport system permease protein
MFNFILKRVLGILPTILLVSFISFFVIQIQPGSALDSYLEDPRFSKETVENIRVQFGLDKSPLEQYGNWIRGILTRGDFGFSFLSGRSVTSQIGELIGWTVLVSLVTFIFSWIVAIPLGVLVATRKNSLTDAIASFLGYIGVSTPDFLIALLLMALILNLGGKNVGGLFSNEFIDAPWSWARFGDLLNHLWQPILVIGVPHIAALMRQMRSSMLDVLNQGACRTHCDLPARGSQRNQSAREHRRVIPARNHQWNDHLEHCFESTDDWATLTQSTFRERPVRRHDHSLDLKPALDGRQSAGRYRPRSSRSKDSL